MATHITLTHDVLQQKFKEFDRDHDGKLTLPELHEHLEELLNTGLSDESVKNIFEAIDKESDGFVTEEEWEAFLGKTSLRKIEREDLKRAFEKIDKDGDGFLTKDEMLEVMKSKNRCPTDEQFAAMMKNFDKNQDEKIDFSEFVVGFYSQK